MNKDSVFFSIHSYQPDDSRRFYFHSNKFDSNNLLNYMIDPHSFDDIANKEFGFQSDHDNKIFDIKQGFSEFKDIPKVHKKSMVFTGIISFDDQLSQKTVFAMHWQDICDIVFQTILKSQDFNYRDWEMQANMHYNTNNKHIQFRIYQNENTEDVNLYERYFLKKETLEKVKENVYDFVFSKEYDQPLNYPHILKAKALQEDNQVIRKYKSMIEDFLAVMRLKGIKTVKEKTVVSKIADEYYKTLWFDTWINSYLRKLKLTNSEKKQLEDIIKNNIISEIFKFVNQNKQLKVIDFISVKDPMDKKSAKKQNFKNFDKISKQVDFDKLASYTNKTILTVYKEPFSRFIDLVFKNQQFNLSELEVALNNKLLELRPELKAKAKFMNPYEMKVDVKLTKKENK